MYSHISKSKAFLSSVQSFLILLVISANGGMQFQSIEYQNAKLIESKNSWQIFEDQNISENEYDIERTSIGTNSSEKSTFRSELSSQQIRFERISIEQGLSQSSIYSIYQDSQGFIWFGTEDGLNKFDGYEFKIYRHDPDDPGSLSDNSVFSIFEDKNEVLWVGTYGRGLNRFDRKTEKFVNYRHDPDVPTSVAHDSINVIENDAEGNLWIGTWNGLDRFDAVSEEFIHYTHDPDNLNSLGSNTIVDLHLDNRGILWVATYGGGLSRYDPSSDSFYRYRHDIINPHRISSDLVTSICEDADGNLWIGTADEGLNKFVFENEEFYTFKSDSKSEYSLSQNSISALAVDLLGNIWIGMGNGGIDIFDPEVDQFQNLSNNLGDPFSLSGDMVTEAFVDRSGIVWIGTFGAGINRFDPQTARFSYYRHIPNDPDSLAANGVMSISENTDGNLWLGILGGGVDLYERSTENMVHHKNIPEDPSSLSSDEVWSVYTDQSGTLWVGTRGGGLNRLDPDSDEFIHYTHDPEDADSLAMNAINAIYEDRDGYLWIGTAGSGLDRLDRTTEKFSHYRYDPENPNSLIYDLIWSIIEDRTGKLWLGTGGGGVSMFDPSTGTFINYIHDPEDPNTVGDTDILTIFEDSRGWIWLGTYGSGLDKYDPATGEFKHFRVADGLPNNVVYGILEDKGGNLWLSTNFGLSEFDPILETFKNFDVSDGIQSNEFNVGAHLLDSKGEMFFGGINGLTSFFPEDIEDSTYLPPVVLTSLRQGGEETSNIEGLQEIVLTWGKNNLEFSFVALNYSHPEKSVYAYKLDGFDEDWNVIGSSRNGRYTNLPGGTYTLRLKATNSDGIWNEDAYSITVRVVPPFWETWWFIGIITLVIMAGVISGYRLRIRSIEARSRELEDQVKVRTEEIELRRIELEALYQADEVIDQNLSLESRLKALVDVSIDILHADKSAIFIWDEAREKYVIKISRGFSAEAVQELAFGKDEGVIGEAVKTSTMVVVQDGHNDPRKDLESPELVKVVLNEGIRSFMFLPIKIGDEIFGVFNVNFKEPDAIGLEEKRVFTALTQHSALSIQNAQLFEQLRDLAIAEERSRLARDLHDSAKQKAFAALAQLGAATGIIDRNPDASKSHLLEAEELVHEVLQELIILIQEMYPATLREMGLASSVRDYVFNWENQCDIYADVKIMNERQLPLEIEQSIYRVVQESLANVARHSQAKKVEIAISYNSDEIEVLIVDDGIGFEVSRQPAGFGLRSMRERVELIGGKLLIDSEIGQGTRIKVIAPITL